MTAREKFQWERSETWRLVDLAGLREAYPESIEFQDDEDFVRDAFDNGVREPYFEVDEW